MWKKSFLISFFLYHAVFAQDTKRSFDLLNLGGDYKNILALAFEDNWIWIGFENSIVKYNHKTDEKLYFDLANAPLPDDKIVSIAIDRRGNKWFGFSEGYFAKYDGKRWEVFDKRLNKMVYDVDNLLAIRTFRKVNLNEQQHAYLPWKILLPFFYDFSFDTDNEGGVFTSLNHLAVDSSNNLWIATDRGIVRYDGQQFQVYNKENANLPSDLVDFVTLDHYGNKWFATRRGLVKFDGKTWESILYNINKDSALIVNCFMIDPFMNVWIVDYDGLIKYDGKTWKNLSREVPLLSSQKIHRVSMSKDSVVWVLGSNGLFSFSNDTWSFHPLNFEEIEFKYLRNPMGIDKEGNIWIASRSSLIQFKKRKKKEVIFSKPNIDEETVFQIYIDQKQNVWLGTSGGILKFNGTKWINFEFDLNLFVPCFYPMKGLFTLATSYGLVFVDGEKIRSIQTFSSSIYEDIDPYQMYFDSSGNLWSASSKGLVKLVDRKMEVFNKVNAGLPSSNIYSMVVDRSGHFWIGTDYGLCRFDGKSCHHIVSDDSGIVRKHITSVNIDRNGNIWIGTRDGYLGKFDGEKWSVYNLKDFGFSCNGIFYLTFDTDNNLWFIPFLKFESNTRFRNEVICSPAFENNRFSGFRKDTVQIPFHESLFNILVKFDGENLTTFPLAVMPILVYDLKADKNNNLWLATNKGLFIFNEKIIKPARLKKAILKEKL